MWCAVRTLQSESFQNRVPSINEVMMKTPVAALLLIAALFLVPNLCSAGSNIRQEESGQGLHLEIFLEYKETSKDSNWRRFNISVNPDKVVLVKEFGGFGGHGKESAEKKMDADLEARIRTYLREHQLDQSLEEISSTQGLGISGVLRMELKGPQPSILHLEGKTKIWGTDEYVEKNWGAEYVKSRTNLKHAEYLASVEFLFNLLWSLAK